jgi:hypothetical protein
VPGARHGQEFSDAFDDAENQRLDQQWQIQDFPARMKREHKKGR